MRWLQINCVLLAGFAILSATNAEGPRDKRDLTLIKKIIKSAIFGRENKTTTAPILINNEENVRIFKVPGFDNILIKAIPKVPVAVAVPEKFAVVQKVVPISVAEHQTASMVASYLGTQTESETLKALQGLKTLLSLGVSTAKKGIIPVAPVLPPLKVVTVSNSMVERPQILFDSPTIYDDIPVNERPVFIPEPEYYHNQRLLSIFHRPIPFPSVFKPVKPVQVPVPVLPTRYLYKQIHGDGRVTTYTSNDNHNVMVTESNRRDPLPPFVTHRLQEVIKSGAHGMSSMPIFEGHIRKPVVQYFDTPKVNYSPHASNYLYKQIHKDGTATSYSSEFKGDNVIVTQTGKVPTLPEFITESIEKVAATAVTGKQPNILLSAPHIGQVYWYKQPINTNPIINIRGGVPLKMDSKEQQKVNIVSKGTYSYQTIHKDGTVTNHYESTAPVLNHPAGNIVAKPISPAHIGNKLESIAQASGGSFSYKILHKDGSVTNYGVFGVHKGIDGGNKIVPLEKKTPIFHASTPQLNKEGSSGSFTYKIIHNDGSVSSHSNTGVVEKKGSNIPASSNNNERDKLPIEYQGTGQVSGSNRMSATDNVFHQNVVNSEQNPSVGSFSYKTIHNDGSMTIYSQNGVSEINGIQKKNLNQDKNQNSVRDKQEVIENAKQNVQVNYAVLPSNRQVNEQSNVSPISGSFPYKKVHSDGSMTIISQNGVKEERDKNQQSLIVKSNQVKDSVPSKQNMKFDDTNVHMNAIDVSTSNYEYTKATNIIPPAPKLQETSTNVITDSTASILVADSNKLLLTKPIVSSYSYKQINHNQPDQFTVAVNIDETASKDNLKVSNQVVAGSQTYNDSTADQVLNDYVYIPPVIVNELPPVKSLVPIEEIHTPPSAVVLAPVEDVTCVEKLSDHPIVVLDEPMSYSYEHRKVDGSAVIMESDQTVVSVTITPKKDNVKRGDIP